MRTLLFLLAGFATQAFASTQTVWLGWDGADPEENIVEYHVFYGTQSRLYTNSDTSYYYDGDYIYGLDEGKTYYFAVTAVDADGKSSPISAEVAYTVPVPPAVPLQTEIYYDSNGTAYGMGISGSWSSPTDWELDYSSDLLNWSPWQAGHGTDCYTYVQFDWGDQYFFRLVLF